MLKGDSASDYQAAPIRIFVMGENVWRDEHEWPLKRTAWTKFFLHSSGQANTAAGDGRLSTQAPTNEPADTYAYDPADPVLTRGGNHSVGPYNPGLYELSLPGPYDQKIAESRDDVLVYTTQPLDRDTEVTGPIWVHLFAKTDARDTDFVARLCDVYEDGRSINITEGVIRGRFWRRQWDTTELLEPGRVYEFRIELQPTANVFKRGHRIRLQVTSSNFPLWDRNLNTGEDPATGTRMRVANQTILHDAAHPSHAVLPLIRR
jgi:putative CocE/NonD family hydrolase